MGTTMKGCGSCLLFIITTIIVYKLSLPIFLDNFDPEEDTRSDNRMLPRMQRTYGGRYMLCHQFRGDLSDQMFQYASLLGIAARQNRMIISNGGDSDLENYLVNIKVSRGASHCKGLIKLLEASCCMSDEKLLNLNRERNYEIEGLLKSWHYFKDHEDMIRKSLVFQNSIKRDARKIIEEALVSRNISLTKTTLVGVHVKRGNRLKQTSVNMGYRVAPKDYFERAMNFFRQKVNGPVTFIVVSEDQLWCRDNLLGPRDVIDVLSHKPETDLAVLTMLDHTIMSVGSFSWWAAFLNKGAVVYYKDPIAKDSKLMADHGGTLNNYFLPSWIAMD